MNRLEQGHPTYNGLLSALQKGETENGTCCLMWYNSEIKQCIGVGERAIREEHLTQFAEGTIMGKRTEDDEIALFPNPWFLIGAQLDALAEKFGTSDNGRLRAFSLFLDASDCLEVAFADKFLCRGASFRVLASLA